MRYYEDPPAPTPLDRVRDLADHLADLAVRVRSAVAEAVAETLARIARDAADRLLRPGPPPVVGDRHSGEYGDEPDPWADPEADRLARPSSTEGDNSDMRSVLARAIAAGLATAGWWARRGSPLGAVGAGAAVAAAVAGGGRLGGTGRALAGVLADLLALAGPLTRRAVRRHGP